MPYRQDKVEVDYADRTLTIYGKFTPAFPETREEPGEPAGFEITKIVEDGKDVTDELADDFDEIEDIIMENADGLGI